MYLCYKKFINLCKHANMDEHVMVETLTRTFNAILGGGGGNVYNMMLHVNAATLRGQHLLFCVFYNAISENHSVQNSPWGIYSELKA